MTEPTRRFLLGCGLFSSLLYVAMNVLGPWLWPDYRSGSQAVSELSAVGVPSRQMWVGLGLVYSVLMAMFGVGLRVSAEGRQSRKTAGTLLAAYGLVGLAAPFAPMQPRGATFATTDAVHIGLTAVTLMLMLVALIFGSGSLGRRFRAYSVATILAMLLFGNFAARDGARLAQGLPAPWLGVWERIDIGVFLLWVGVLSVQMVWTARHPFGGEPCMR